MALHARYADIQTRDLVELRAVLPAVRVWWDARVGDDPGKPSDFRRRWPAGPVAHPRVLDVVRRYWLEASRLDLEIEAPAIDDTTDPEADAEELHVRPADLLIHDLQAIDPELFKIMASLVFVPIGAGPAGEAT